MYVGRSSSLTLSITHSPRRARRAPRPPSQSRPLRPRPSPPSSSPHRRLLLLHRSSPSKRSQAHQTLVRCSPVPAVMRLIPLSSVPCARTLLLDAHSHPRHGRCPHSAPRGAHSSRAYVSHHPTASLLTSQASLAPRSISSTRTIAPTFPLLPPCSSRSPPSRPPHPLTRAPSKPSTIWLRKPWASATPWTRARARRRMEGKGPT